MSQKNIQSKLGRFINGLRGKSEETHQETTRSTSNIAQPEIIVDTSTSLHVDAVPPVSPMPVADIDTLELTSELAAPSEPASDWDATSNIETVNNQLQEVLNASLAEVPEGKALAYVDIAQRRLLGVATADPLPDSVQQLIAAATADLFVAPNVIKVSNIFKEKKGLDADVSNFNEMIVHGDGAVYVFLRAQSNNDRIGVFSCHNRIPFGLVLHHARQLMPNIEVAAEAAFLSEHE